MIRPSNLVVVVGTGTEVGKTYVAVELLGAWRHRGSTVSARKPVQSFDPADEAAGAPTDRQLLAEATGEEPDAVCPPHRSLPRAMAPPMAADSLGLAAIHAADLLGELTWPEGVDVGLVETAGGAGSPIAHDATSAELAHRLEPDAVVLVADAGLGTIHSVVSTAPLLAGLDPVVLLNRFDPDDELHRRNRAWLSGLGLDPVVDLAELLHRLAV